MPILTKLKDFLDANHVVYEVRSHPRAFTAQEVAAAQHVRGREVAKVAVLPAPYHVDIARLGEATGKHDLRVATEAEFAGLFPSCEPGAMPPFGNLYGVPVWVDRSLTQDEEIFFNAGNHEQTVHLSYTDFARLVQPRIASFGMGRPVE
jgi:Ala-tRNA(Pro) deacylase